MRRWLEIAASACALLLATVGQAVAATAPEPRTTNPDWAEKPSGEDMARYYPDHAARMGLGGKATIVCKINLEGRLTDCAVASESPAGEGFGDATLKVASKFRMTPQTRDGVPVNGASVRIPVVYTPPPPMSVTLPKDAARWLFVAALALSGGAILLLGGLIGAYRLFGRSRER